MNTAATATPTLLAEVFGYHLEDLIQALRRDHRRETEAAYTDRNWREFHERNARNDISLLQIIAPRQPDRSPNPFATAATAPAVTAATVSHEFRLLPVGSMTLAAAPLGSKPLA